ncbi:MAG TPA: bifunctional riboflavin kinase/FAD synthetase [Gemmatimonadaceae bacterium]|nr:bifunctional riboflavin kinase/FAD synthetase [Gemmatimonadaceae bacterium]
MRDRVLGSLDPEALPRGRNGTVVTVGTFDGVHRGHRLVLDRTAECARRSGLVSVALTFEPHPLDVVNPSAAPPLLTLWDEKLEALAQTPIDYLAVIPFTMELSRYTPEAFVERVLIGGLGMRELLIGHDHGFGRGRAGDAESLRLIGRRRGFPVDVVDAVLGTDGSPISSTGIRRAIAHGDLTRAFDGLGRCYSFAGRVVSGQGRGRGLGYPTLNLEVGSTRKLLPPHGVYAVFAQGHAGAFGGMMNLGPRPTFGEQQVRLEVHLFDATGDWYGDSVRVDFVSRLRDTMKFSGPAELMAQLNRDADNARAALTAIRPEANVNGSGTNTSSLL